MKGSLFFLKRDKKSKQNKCSKQAFFQHSLEIQPSEAFKSGKKLTI